jgi:predicted ATP-binding protein involved in virulence
VHRVHGRRSATEGDLVFIQRVVVKNYRCLKKANVTFNEKLNVIVGNNECGKSTLHAEQRA